MDLKILKNMLIVNIGLGLHAGDKLPFMSEYSLPLARLVAKRLMKGREIALISPDDSIALDRYPMLRTKPLKVS